MIIPLWTIGVALAVLASVVSNLGLTFQKLAHLRNAQLVKDRHLAVSAVSKSGEPSETRSSISQEPDDEMSETKFSFPNDPDCSAPLFEPVSLVRRDSKGNLNAAAAGKEPTKQTNQGEENSNGNEVSRHSPKLAHPDKSALANDSTASLSPTSSDQESSVQLLMCLCCFALSVSPFQLAAAVSPLSARFHPLNP
jgi:hypothetical protein